MYYLHTFSCFAFYVSLYFTEKTKSGMYYTHTDFVKNQPPRITHIPEKTAYMYLPARVHCTDAHRRYEIMYMIFNCKLVLALHWVTVTAHVV